MTCAADRRGAVRAFAVVLFSLMLALLAPRAALAAPKEKYAALVMDAATGEVLYARHADATRYPASLTKVMTLYLTFEALENGSLKLTDTVTMSPRAAAQPPSKLGLKVGERLTVEQAIFALCTKSANDVAVALAEKVAGSEARFAARMNQRAKALGMKKTRFVNPHGLPDARHVSSARDLAILSRAILRDFPEKYAYFGAQHWTFRGHRIRNHNGLLGRVDGVDGIKTGYTRASGFNLAASGERDGRRLIAVVLGGRTTRSRDAHVAELLEAGFEARRRAGTTVAALLGREGAAIEADQTPVPDTDDEDVAEGGEPDPADEPAPEPARAEPAKVQAGDWQIQAGAFKRKAEADAWLKQVQKRFAAEVRGARASVRSGGGWHRVRFSGLSEDAAARACEAMKARKAPCLALRG